MFKYLFTLLDIPYFVICLGSVGLCSWGYASSETPGKKFVCLITGIFFLLFAAWLPIWRRLWFTYFTKQEIRVKCGKLNKPGQNVVELWTEELINKFDVVGIDARKYLPGAFVYFADQELLKESTLQRLVYGYSRDKYAKVGYGDTAHVYRLFLHEVGHIILRVFDPNLYSDETTSHKKLETIGV